MSYVCCGEGFEAPRRYLTKEEKIEMLEEYKDSLENEVKGIEERIKELKRVN
ncbi:MAG: hypothetical protein QT03_C0001G1253 [archaeon GW2011_AR10]|uniref:DUF5320 domain-containing protein n=1 Tax=Candidatus Iainarchaeum sp. TaxID=3101447 RepID=A0A7J4IRJ3_9ARCH|nr:MAG: hypothetical protein QT03_C0001G1253 [archaeon GW2011_AR10]HIH08131.1 DUF5320 domain-containing protein [Candidatus Diapherotrites archaeon]